ncbi:MAG: hypothetical protein E6R00_11450 [Gammaproteobacteria bacterium]|nr:MAG: hypothetical protein E6R00_11450 [Gammaproteobacteria bacterium]
MKHAYEISMSLRHVEDLSVSVLVEELRRLTVDLGTLSPTLNEWLLVGETKEAALLYEVFKEDKVTTAALAVLDTRLKNQIDPRIVAIWNGHEGHAGASLRIMARPAPHLSIVNFVGRPDSFSDDWQKVANVIAGGARIWSPIYAAVESNGYSDIKIFKDRPGVGWMLYLPQVLTVQQVPEARALVPVMGKDAKGKDKQLGTIMVSVTDEPFSDENPEHVKIANAIEIRLVDQDLLPRFSDL